MDSNGALLAQFAEFYEEVARLKQAIEKGQLAIYLADGKEIGSPSVHDLAALMNQRLHVRLQERGRQIALLGTQAEIESHHVARYAAAALADELFVIELDWPGRDAWQACLLEQSLFGSNTAGRDFFRRLEKLLGSRAVSPLEEELAAVFLMSLRLGFKGQCRGEINKEQLNRYSSKLIRFIGNSAGHQASFQQAYQYRIVGVTDERMAPLSRWYKLGAICIGVYLLISTVVWVMLTNRFTQALG